MEGHGDLIVWQKAMELVVEIYRSTKVFPKNETYGLSSQMQRAAVSIPSNIAEGEGLKQTHAYLRHLAIAAGSLAELQTQVEIAKRLGYISLGDSSLAGRMSEIGRLLTGLQRSLRAKAATSRPES